MGFKTVAQVTAMAAAPLILFELLSIWRTYRNNRLLKFKPANYQQSKPKTDHGRPASCPVHVPPGSDDEQPVSSSEDTPSSVDIFPDKNNNKVDSSIGQLARYILLARDSIDVCQYSITSSFLTEAILRRHHLGVRVRVITDHEGANILSSQMEEFYRQGIQVRPHRGSGLMHHKFIVIDNKIVATGSFNFTAQATLENYENIIVSDNMDIVGRYVQNFAKLWKRFDYAASAAKEARQSATF